MMSTITHTMSEPGIAKETQSSPPSYRAYYDEFEKQITATYDKVEEAKNALKQFAETL